MSWATRLLAAAMVTLGLWSAAPAAGQDRAALAQALDAWVQQGLDEPQRALQRFTELAAQATAAEDRRALLRARGLVAASAGLADELHAALLALAALAPDPMAAADAALVRAEAADAQGHAALALEAATAAVQGYEAACTAQTSCDHRAHWQALMLLARQDRRRGLNSAALEHAQAAAALAEGAGDRARQAQALAAAADMAGLQGDAAAEQGLFAQALRLARADGDALLRSRVQAFDTRIQRRRGDNEASRRAANAGLALARQGGPPRLEATHLANLSDVLVALGQPALALKAVAEALPTARRHGDHRVERVLLHNAALARIHLGQLAQARQQMEGVLAAYRAGGATADLGLALREFGDAFAAAGDLPTALRLFHQERQLAAEMMAANREAALAELRRRFDHEAQQRKLEQLQRERTLVTAQLANRAALQQVWAAGAVVLLLAGVLVAVVYHRVRRLRSRLEKNQALLRAQSHRDPLTGLHNRRGLHETMAPRGGPPHFEGALLLLDIDHFKRVNDHHGHAAGDAVLVEVARRLAEIVGPPGLVVRWGGEEFIVCLAGSTAALAPAATQALARRVLHAVGGTPVALPGGTALRVTVSVGYACFPLPPARLPLSLDRAINLVDMALYTAKNQGRNNATGIVQAQGHDAAALQALELNFDLARHEGRVLLERLDGPADPTPPPGAGPGPGPGAGAEPGQQAEAQAHRLPA